MKQTVNKKRIIVSLIVFSILCFTFVFNEQKALANPLGYTESGMEALRQLGSGGELDLNKIKVSDKLTQTYTLKDWMQLKADNIKSFLQNNFLQKFLKDAGSAALQSAISTTLKQMAYDTATYLATGGEGQKPIFFKEGWGEFWSNVADTAAGNFIEALGREWNFNLCEPSSDVRLRIGLGLYQYARPSQPACTWRKMVNAWDNEFQRLQDLNSDDFLEKFQNIFDPASNDLGIALSVQNSYIDAIQLFKNEKSKDREESGGWLDFRGIASVRNTFPTYNEKEAGSIFDSWNNAYKFTGSALVDAANVFANQYAITLIKEKLRKLAENKDAITSPYTGDYGGLQNYEFGVTGGTQAAEENFRKIIEPNFNVRGDYNILAELTTCPDPNKAGPTNCVIDENFRQAIQNKLTVGQAMKDGYLNENGNFGFLSSDLEPSYLDGAYPYRSMKILRKFRIIPVGWELAAQYIRDNNVGTCNLGDMVSCYSDNDEYNSFSNSCNIGAWCENLVNPNWVLKAPMNYCAREGYGPELIMTDTAGGEVIIARNDNYCADEQSCIKETDDGACEKYGYCVEERGKWNFGGKSCDSQYNTCQTFRSQDGRTVSYLENTLEYCQESGVGCTAYCTDYESGEWQCSSVNENTILFNRNVGSCEQENEGCHEFIRTKAGLGANLLRNSDFSNDLDSWTATVNGTDSKVGITTIQGRDGSITKALAITQGEALASSYVRQTIYGIMPGEEYTVSYYVKSDLNYNSSFKTGPYLMAYAQSKTGTIIFDPSGGELYLNASVLKDNYPGGDYWQQRNFSFITPPNTSRLIIEPKVENAEGVAYFDDIKVERGKGTTYSNYRGNGLVYLKLLPGYLEEQCYDASGDLLDNAPEKCSNFVRKCKEEEVGCELYISQTDGTQIPGKTTAQDVCDDVCVGYDMYIQSATPYDYTEEAYFIPSTARSCGAESVGCEEFTNLDKIGSGAEEREYYSQLRTCIKPGGDCNEFYTWEGDDETGYQIRVHQLKDEDNDGEPDVNDEDYNNNFCNEDIFNLASTEPEANPDCREFTDKLGHKSYRLYSLVIKCTDDCHPYRLSDTYGDMTDTECSNLGGEWLNESCVFMAIPNEGRKCSATQVGCREYNGNQGNNTRILFTEDFEKESDWTPDNRSQDAVIAGEHSLKITSGNPASLELGYLVNTGASYVLGFIARGASNSLDVSVSLANGSATSSFSLVNINGTDWKYYKINLGTLDHNITENEKLVISGTEDFYIDNIRLTEITDRYYLVKNSWNTPDVCDEDIYGNFVLYNDLSCDHYKDRDGLDYYFHNFSELCPESAAGCELMIDTQNYSDYNFKTWASGTPSGFITVEQDNPNAYIVYDPEKSCSYIDKGCQFFGDIYDYNGELTFTDVYLKNDPDNYDKSLCGVDDIGCEAWDYAGGPSYFKDPQLKVCEWRQENGSYNWYKKKVQRCGGIGSLCFRDSDCAEGEICLDDTAEPELCEVSDYKTIGLGGYGQRVVQPTEEKWAGVCPASESGCSEYIDPLSIFSSNLIFNPAWKNIDGSTVVAGNLCNFTNDYDGDGWSGVCKTEQEVNVEPYTLYVLTDTSNSGTTIKDCQMRKFDLSTNRLSDDIVTSIDTSSNNGNVLFYTTPNTSSCTISGGGAGKTINLRKAMVNYQIKTELDKSSCNGVVNNDIGCVLFNERVVNGNNSYLTLDKNAYLTDNGDSPSLTPPYNANSLIKVSPDRTCNKWLSCRSYVKDDNGNDQCFSIGLCDSFDENNNCDNPIISSANPKNFTYGTGGNLSPAEIANLSGYSKVGYIGTSFNIKNDKVPNDIYSLGDMKEVGENVYIPNGSFEFSDSYHYPYGWYYEGGIGNVQEVDIFGATTTKWNANIFRTISSVSETNSKGVCFRRDINKKCYLFAPDGNSFLQLGAKYWAKSDMIDLIAGDYTLTAYINTTNLLNGKAKIQIEDLKGEIKGMTELPERSKDWIFKVIKFKVDNNQIKIKLFTEGDNEGGVAYFDDIKIKPSLKVSNYQNDEWRIPQTCRLYPEDNSLSCDYYNDERIRNKGWEGYCLDYDRSPGNKDACIMWYPLDKVKGEGIEEGAGYGGRYPLYYCVEAQHVFTFAGDWSNWVNSGVGDPPGANFTRTYYGTTQIGNNVYFQVIGSEGGGGDSCDNDQQGSEHTLNGWRHGREWKGVCIDCCDNVWSSGYPLPAQASYSINGENWYDYSIYTDILLPQINQGQGTLCTDSCLYYRVSKPASYRDGYVCTKLAKVVSSVGQTKYYSGRVYDGSSFALPCNQGISLGSIPNICRYDTDSAPFGAITPPSVGDNELDDPTVWDADPNTFGNQPLMWRGIASGAPRMGQLYTVENLQKIYAKSYGLWYYNNASKKYENTNTISWNPPSALCDGDNDGTPDLDRDGHEAREETACSIRPLVQNITIVNFPVGNPVISKVSFVNLQFYSDVDNNQLPMVMYRVYWGDNEQTIVSGVEMRDRPRPADYPNSLGNPHSLYHLYSYWDMKSKHNIDMDNNTIYCGQAGEIAKNKDNQDAIKCPGDSACCMVKPLVTVKDNWGWCNNGTAINDCSSLDVSDAYDKWIIVTEN